MWVKTLRIIFPYIFFSSFCGTAAAERLLAVFPLISCGTAAAARVLVRPKDKTIHPRFFCCAGFPCLAWLSDSPQPSPLLFHPYLPLPTSLPSRLPTLALFPLSLDSPSLAHFFRAIFGPLPRQGRRAAMAPLLLRLISSSFSNLPRSAPLWFMHIDM